MIGASPGCPPDNQHPVSGARNADPPVGGVGRDSDRERTKRAVPPRGGPVSTTRCDERQSLVAKRSTRRDDDSARTDSIDTAQ